MNAVLDLPPIDAALAAEPAKAMTLAELATQPLARMEPDLLALSARYRNVAFDLKTPKGLAAMKAARHDLRENGRFAVQRACDAFKKDANAAKRAVEETAERLVGIVRPQEDDYTKAIEAREAEIEAEKAEKARLEAERVAKLQAGIATIRSYVQKAAGLPSERIAKGIADLAAWTFPTEQWAEFAVPAANAQCETLEALRRMHVAAVQAEADKAARERLEAEAAERAATEAAAMAARIVGHTTVTTPSGIVADAHTGEVLHKPEPALYRPLQDAPVAVQACRQEDRAMLATQAGAELVQAAATALAAEPADPPASVHVDTSEQPTVKLGDLNARLGFTMTEAFVRDVLKVKPAESKGRAVLIPEAALPDLADELVARIREVLG